MMNIHILIRQDTVLFRVVRFLWKFGNPYVDYNRNKECSHFVHRILTTDPILFLCCFPAKKLFRRLHP